MNEEQSTERQAEPGPTKNLGAPPLQPLVRPERPNVSPQILVGLLGSFPYMMPPEFLPLMDCDNCVYRRDDMRDGGHCYMFREQPTGDRCGQFRRV